MPQQPANDNATTGNISGMTAKEVVAQEAYVNELLDAMEASDMYEWEFEQ